MLEFFEKLLGILADLVVIYTFLEELNKKK